MNYMGVEFEQRKMGVMVAHLQVRPLLLDRIRELQMQDEQLKRIRQQVVDKRFASSVLRFGRRGKLNPRYIGPYTIMERVGTAAYRLDLPSEMSKLHNVFHVSMLRKYVADPSHVLVQQPVELEDDLSYVEEPVQILDRREQVLRIR
ncbi:uncharacterized protein LOC130749911 [Actinidia eriantha]|uniref:uncharacterized protein LOC130749911 n=1 Tax=Actinidia eriantha TaxID=165200 RepID=UPI00258DD034|nr:uncharacterized protein LOC130749911 [Actinidia eriantha]